MRLEAAIAGRYLRGRRSSRLVSLTTFIATGGVTVGVMALIVVLGVMNGLQRELREKILVGSPDLRILTFGQGLRMDGWREALATVRRDSAVVAAEPFVLTQALFNAGHDYNEGAYVLGIETDTGTVSVTGLARTFVRGSLAFTTTQPDVDGGIVVGRRFAERMSAYPGSTVTAVSFGGTRFNAAVGTFVPKYWRFEVTGYFETGMDEYDNSYVVMPRPLAQQVAGLGDAVTGLEVRLDPDRQDDEVVLGLDNPAAVLDVLVLEDEVAVGLLDDVGHPALDVVRAHRLRALVELVVALAGCPDVHVVDGHVGQWQGAHQQLVLLDRVHAAEPRAERVADRLVARSGAHHVGDAFGHLAVARAQDVAVRAGRGQQSLDNQGVHHVG